MFATTHEEQALVRKSNATLCDGCDYAIYFDEEFGLVSEYLVLCADCNGHFGTYWMCNNCQELTSSDKFSTHATHPEYKVCGDCAAHITSDEQGMCTCH